MKLSIVIPCLNEVKTIVEVIKNARESGKKYLENFEIIVADNGSTDGTLEKLSPLNNVKIINVPVKGYGAALHSAILFSKYPYVLFADADLSYDFDQIHKFLPYLNKKYDLVLGSRYKGSIEAGAMPVLNRYVGTPLLTLLIRIIYGIKSTDCNSGMRAVKKNFYKKLVMKNSGMEWASELLIKTALNRGKYAEVPISFSKDKRNTRTHLRRWEDGWRHLKVIILLRPEVLIFFAGIMLLIGIFSLRYSLFTTLSMVLFAEFWILSYLALQKLRAAIHKKTNWINDKIDRLPLVLIACVLTVFGIAQLFIISDNHLFTKYIFLFQTVLLDLWIFFVETIKTHLINPLPDSQ